MLKKIIIILFFSIALLGKEEGLDDIPDFVEKGDTKYIIRLIGGDIIKGYVDDFNFKEGKVNEIVFTSQLGKGPIKVSKIKSIEVYEDYYKHNHRAYIMPTAYPISSNHYVGSFMLAVLYGGVGIYDYVSISGGRSLVPGVFEGQQFSNINIKATPYQTEWTDRPGGMAVGLGFNSAWVNDVNNFQHFFLNASFKGERTIFTGMAFYKSGNRDLYTLSFRDQIQPVTFADGNFGLGVALDTKLSNWESVHFIGEIWNGNITEPSNTGILAGLRLFNGQFSADFGILIFTEPIAAPFASFVWTPF
jgi:hypothetical protein